MQIFNKKFLISIVIFFIIILFSISIILANNVIDDAFFEKNEEKIYYEIKYLDNKIFDMTNLLSNIEDRKIFNINWEKIKEETHVLYNYWNSVILDLNNLIFDKKSLTDFGKEMDKLSLSIKEKNKNQTLKILINLYRKLNIYLEEFNKNINYQNIMLTKYNLLCAYYFSENGNWTQAHDYILNASEHIYKVVNDIKLNFYLQYNMNKAYIAVKELENLINIKDIDVFYFKYNNAINILMNLTIQ